MNIGLSIKMLRKQAGFSQIDLANKAGLTQTGLSQIESGLKSPNTKTVERICEAMSIPASLVYLYSMEESDIPAAKREDFNKLIPKLKELLATAIKPSDSNLSGNV